MSATTQASERLIPPADEAPVEPVPSGQASSEEDPARGLVGIDEQAFAAIYRRWSPLVHTLAARTLGDAREAEDVAQQVFLAAWRGRAGYHPERGPLGAWLVGITRRKIVDTLAARTRRLRLIEAAGRAADVSTGVLRSETTDRALDRVLLSDALARLPQSQREVLRMVFYDDLTQVQISERTGLPLGTVKSHARRGLFQLRSKIEQS
ncbi:sigma-70 family RNA polymerase sigma factor [Streptomyces sp. NPDC055239]